MTTKLLTETTLSVQTCADCGVIFAIPEHLEKKCRGDGRTFYCPNGHSLWFGKSEADKLKEQLKQSEKNVTRLLHEFDQERTHRQHTERRLSATRGVLTKTKNRIHNGVCPCCNRSFVNLQRHMKGQHPDYLTEQTLG